MSIEDNKSIICRWQYEVLNTRNLDLFDEVIHPDYILHGSNIRGREAARAAFSDSITNPPDNFENLDMFGEGDKVVSRWINQVGGKRYKGISVFRIAEGKIIEDWYCAEEVNTASLT